MMIINELEAKKSSGSYNISNFLSRLTGRISTQHTTYFTNRSITESILPEQLKLAQTTPLHKSKTKTDVKF